MSFYADICDAWIAELTTSVDALADVHTHRYAPWSRELLYAEQGERHLAVFPLGEPEVVDGMTVRGDDLAAQTYTVLVWEDTGGDAERMVENPETDEAWLQLYEDIRQRFYVAANIRLGSAQIMATRYRGGSFDRSGNVRAMEIRFMVQVPHFYGET